MIPIFLYSSMYAVTPKLRKLAVDKKLQEECILALTRTGELLILVILYDFSEPSAHLYLFMDVSKMLNFYKQKNQIFFSRHFEGFFLEIVG